MRPAANFTPLDLWLKADAQRAKERGKQQSGGRINTTGREANTERSLAPYSKGTADTNTVNYLKHVVVYEDWARTKMATET